jgi:S1/P1 Nuclease
MNTARSFFKTLSFWLAVLAITSLPTLSVAFGPVGHETIAFIAQDRLSPATLVKIRELLDREEDLAEVANWADVIRPFRKKPNPGTISICRSEKTFN